MNILIWINAVLFFLLAAVHVYWVLGGKMGMATAVPTKVPGGERLFEPSCIGTLFVGLGLFLFAVITLANLGFMEAYISMGYIQIATIVVGCIFILRAIGDFKYIGFSKKIKGTAFAENDSRLFSPLCLFLGLASLLIVF
jgi:hypothetical protein